MAKLRVASLSHRRDGGCSTSSSPTSKPMGKRGPPSTSWWSCFSTPCSTCSCTMCFSDRVGDETVWAIEATQQDLLGNFLLGPLLPPCVHHMRLYMQEAYYHGWPRFYIHELQGIRLQQKSVFLITYDSVPWFLSHSRLSLSWTLFFILCLFRSPVGFMCMTCMTRTWVHDKDCVQYPPSIIT